jgi:4-hydroxy-tetrahydrodipicolinate synthase
LILYNVPARTGRNIEPETVERLAALGPVVAIKEASGSLDQVSDILARTDLTVLSGDDSLTLPMLAVGAEGVVSVVGNLVPKDVIELVAAFARGDFGAARRLHGKLFPLCRDLLGLAPNPIPVKTAMALLGRGNGEMRLPLTPPDARSREGLRRSLSRFGLLSGDD